MTTIRTTPMTSPASSKTSMVSSSVVAAADPYKKRPVEVTGFAFLLRSFPIRFMPDFRASVTEAERRNPERI
jgi:hypothetical protein